MKQKARFTFESIVSNTISVILYGIFLAVSMYRLWNNIKDIPTCFTPNSCNQNTISSLEDLVLGIFFIGMTLGVAKIIWNTNRTDANVDEIKKYNELLSEISSGSINTVDEKVFYAFYDKVLEEIAKSGGQPVIIATSSFTPPTQPLRDRYFSELAKLITRYRADYKVLMAKGDGKEWDDACLAELKTREDYLDRAAKEQPEAGWQYHHNFTARRSRYHARMDFLVVEDSVFINMSLAKEIDSNNRGYLYINDRRAAELYKKWFFTIWSNSKYSHAIRYELDPITGKYEFIL